MVTERVIPILNVSNIRESFAWFEKLGYVAPTDMPWAVRELHVRHPDGHVFRMSQSKE